MIGQATGGSLALHLAALPLNCRCAWQGDNFASVERATRQPVQHTMTRVSKTVRKRESELRRRQAYSSTPEGLKRGLHGEEGAILARSNCFLSPPQALQIMRAACRWLHSNNKIIKKEIKWKG